MARRDCCGSPPSRRPSRDPQPVVVLAAWDQGPEMRDWKQVRVDAGIEVFFCDPHSPWQRGSNENTNGLLRQYFPKGFRFSTVTETDLDAFADQLNERPRKRFDLATRP